MLGCRESRARPGARDFLAVWDSSDFFFSMISTRRAGFMHEAQYNQGSQRVGIPAQTRIGGEV